MSSPALWATSVRGYPGLQLLTYVEAVESQCKEDFISACEHALYYYGGVPQAIMPDNLKSAVIKASRYDPVLNHEKVNG